MIALPDRVLSTIARHDMFAPGQRVAVAVSGGADSVCLLHVLHELAPRWALRLSVAHLDHRLRGEESRADAEFVRELAARFGLPFHLREADVAALARDTGDNLEQAAREARRAFFRELIGGGAVDRVALGHTRSDQAETVLFRLLRGTGTAGLAGIRPVTPDGFVRPLIEVERARVEAWLRDRGIPWRPDSTNQDLGLARNRIRHELLPGLAREWNPRLREVLAGMAIVAGDEEEYWRQEIDRLAPRYLTIKLPAVCLPADRLAELPQAVVRRLIRRAIEVARGSLRRIDAGHVEQILELVLAREGDGRIQVPELDVVRSFDWVRLAPPGLDSAKSRNYRMAMPTPGRVQLPGNGDWLSVEPIELIEKTDRNVGGESGYNREGAEIDWELLGGPLEVRNWRPGDQYRPVGQTSEAKIKLLFQQARIPLWERRNWPILISGDKIVWALRFGPAAAYAATPTSRSRLRIRVEGRQES